MLQGLVADRSTFIKNKWFPLQDLMGANKKNVLNTSFSISVDVWAVLNSCNHARDPLKDPV